MNKKQQFNIYLPPELIRQIKHYAIDAEQSLSVLVEKALLAYTNDEKTAVATDMTPMPIIYVTDMSRSLQFYQALGLTLHHQGSVWSELRQGSSILALHLTTTQPSGPQQVGLAFVAHQPLEAIVAQLAKAGITPPSEIADEAFGRSLLLYDPDGLAIQINEHDPELHA